MKKEIEYKTVYFLCKKNGLIGTTRVVDKKTHARSMSINAQINEHMEWVKEKSFRRGIIFEAKRVYSLLSDAFYKNELKIVHQDDLNFEISKKCDCGNPLCKLDVFGRALTKG